MRIGVDCMFLVPGQGRGIERCTRALLGAMARAGSGHRFVVFASRQAAPDLSPGLAMRVHAAPVSGKSRAARIAWQQAALPFMAKKAGVDVLFCPANWAPVPCALPTVAMIHDCVPFACPREFAALERTALKFLMKQTAKKARLVITPSEYSKNQVVKYLGIEPQKIRSIPEGAPGISPGEALPPLPPDLPKDFLFTVGSGKPHKNLATLLAAHEMLITNNPAAPALVVAGMGKARPSVPVPDKVVFLNHVPDDLLWSLYKNARLFVFPSLYEGFGLPVIEAMALGAPVAASKAASIPEITGRAALLFDPHDPVDLCRAMENVLENPGLAKEMSQKGREQAARFTWEQAAREVLDVLEKAAGKDGNPF